MLEIGIAVGVLGVLIGFALLVSYASSLVLLWLSFGVVLLGLGIGVPYGVRYHLVLRRLLEQQGKLPKRWFVHPTQYHRLLDEHGREQIRSPFRFGAAGFVLILVGCGLMTLTLLARFRQ